MKKREYTKPVATVVEIAPGGSLLASQSGGSGHVHYKFMHYNDAELNGKYQLGGDAQDMNPDDIDIKENHSDAWDTEW